MIKYTLKCAENHEFESWFSSGSDFERLSDQGFVSCPICGNSEVSKTIMAPQVKVSGQKKVAKPLSQPTSEAEKMLTQMRNYFEKNSEDVGQNFATEARAIHDGEAPERLIHGEAKAEEAKSLIEDGVPVAPLPFTVRKSN